MFVDGAPVAVSDGANTILIKPKMDFGTKQRCMDALAAVGREQGEMDMELRLGAYQLALMVENVVGWQGPAFTGVACNAANIGRLDPDEPLVDQVLAEIVKRNPLVKETSAAKKDGMSGGEPLSPAGA